MRVNGVLPKSASATPWCGLAQSRSTKSPGGVHASAALSAHAVGNAMAADGVSDGAADESAAAAAAGASADAAGDAEAAAAAVAGSGCAVDEPPHAAATSKNGRPRDIKTGRTAAEARSPRPRLPAPPPTLVSR